jgi:hypothetical protein
MLAMQRAGQIILLSVISASSLTSDALAQAGPGNATVPVTEGEQAEARQRYTRGLQLVKEGNYPAALIEMQRAYVLNPSYKIQYNLGQIQAHLSDAAAAVTAYERYLSEGGTEVPPPRATEVIQEIRRLRSRVGSVDLTVKGEGADVLIDDVTIGRSPFAKRILLNIGQHRFVAAQPGKDPVARVMAIAGEDVLTLDLNLANTVAPRAGSVAMASSGLSPDTPSKVEASTEVRRGPASHVLVPETGLKSQSQPSTGTYLWLGWTVAGGFAVGAVATGMVARREANDLRQLRDKPGASRQALDDAHTSTFRAALATDVLTGAAIVTAGVTLYYTLFPGKRVDAGTHVSSGLQLGFDLTGVRVRGSF